MTFSLWESSTNWPRPVIDRYLSAAMVAKAPAGPEAPSM